MRRNAFLFTYVTCLLLTQGSGPWATLAAASISPARFGATAIVSLLIPVALIVLAMRRGETIGEPRLYFWPTAALVVSGMPFFVAWTLLAAGHSPPSADTSGAAAFLGVASVVAPLVLHVLCCIRGAAADKPQAVRAAL